jgi:hygromycin-B 4-O-kinase
VVRFSRWQDDFLKDAAAHRHASVALPIPKVTRVSAAPVGCCAISERAFGIAFDDVDAPRMPVVFSRLLETLDAIRSVDIAASTGYGVWGPNDYAPSSSWKSYLLRIQEDPPGARSHGWRAKLARFPDRQAAFDEAYSRLASLVDACSEERYLVHADLLNGNVLVADGRIAAVLDWGQAMYGDFLYDLAWFSFWSFWCPGLRGLDVEGEALRHYRRIGLDVPNFEERIRCCKLHMGLDSIAYSAFTERWQFVDEVAEHTHAVAMSR